MSFPLKNTHKKTLKKYKIAKRKEQDSFLTRHFKKNNISYSERASSFTSKNNFLIRGNLTIEAALTAPLFFFAVLSLVYLLEMMNTQTIMKSALHYAAKEMAKEAYVNPFVVPGKIERSIIETIGEKRLDQSIIYGGSGGLDCRKSKAWGKTGIMDLSVEYKMEIPVLMFRIPVISKRETLRIKGWNGYNGDSFGSRDEETVYVTDTGIVYHKDADCTYLELSIRPVQSSSISDIRNDSGGKYYPCEFCMKKPGSDTYVYITDTGSRYHGSLRCSGLKRTVFAVPVSDVYGRGGCSRCVK